MIFNKKYLNAMCQNILIKNVYRARRNRAMILCLKLKLYLIKLIKRKGRSYEIRTTKNLNKRITFMVASAGPIIRNRAAALITGRLSIHMAKLDFNHKMSHCFK